MPIVTNPAAGGYTSRIRCAYTRAADATTYAIGDLIGNSTTAASVVPLSFTCTRGATGSGRVTGCRCVITAGSGTVVWPAFDLLLFRPETGVPFTDGSYPADNAALTVSSAAAIELTGILSFVTTGWRNGSGNNNASGAMGYQATSFSTRPYAPFNLTALNCNYLYGLMQVQNTWAPGNVSYQFNFALDCDQD